jgi:hypothetical protein
MTPSAGLSHGTGLSARRSALALIAGFGLAAPYLVDGLAAISDQAVAFVLLTALIAVLALVTAGYAIRSRHEPDSAGDTRVRSA